MAHRFLPFVGSSEPVSAFLESLALAAESDATVLLTGESGTGKTAAARALHAASKRRGGPCQVANLAAIAPTLIEASLFGHERGAFTDAHRARKGLFQLGSGGTVVLDDVDLLPLETQVKLLRVLQERVVEPLGSEESIPVDLKLVATTNADLRACVEAGAFREDLYYRLAVVTLETPPLRVRLGDLTELVPALTARVAERTGVRPRVVSEEGYVRLAAHPWPGNVRELENALERVSVLASRNGDPTPIRPEEFDFLGEAVDGIADEVARRALSHGLTVDVLTRAMMERALADHRGNVSAAARTVGLTRRAFDYRMARKPDEEIGAEEA